MDKITHRITALVRMMARLRDPVHGCPWDLKQDFASIATCTLEEAYEVADAIAREDLDKLCGEVGDLLLQVVYHSQLAHEKGKFDLADVMEKLLNKMITRHPHLPDLAASIGWTGAVPTTKREASPDDAQAVLDQWENIKDAERRADGQAGMLDDVPIALPSLTRAQKIQARVARIGFDFANPSEAFAKIKEETEELREAMHEEDPANTEAELGDLLFSCVNLARLLDLDAEAVLRKANERFSQRFAIMEKAGNIDTKSVKHKKEELELLWRAAKS